MRMSTTGGATPRNRRLDRGRVAIAAIAALFLFAANAQANVVEFEIKPGSTEQNLSYLTYTTKLVGPALGGSKTSIPQKNGQGVYGEASNKTHYFGSMYVDIQDTTIQMLSGATFNAMPTGSYVPADPQPGDSDYVSSATPGTTPNGNYGLAVTAIGLQAVIYNLVLDFGWQGNDDNPGGNPSTPMTLAGENFNLAGQAMEFKAANQAFISALGNDSITYSDPSETEKFPFIFFGTANSDIGTWDGTTLTIPVHSSYSFVVTNDFGGITQFVDVTGQLVLVPKVPEPATVTMFGLGIVGLLVCTDVLAIASANNLALRADIE